jgi:hypothetical protein
MGKIKDNFLKRYLPMWAKECVFAENLQLRKKVARLEQENEVLKSYIDGLKLGLKKRTDDFCSYGERRENG